MNESSQSAGSNHSDEERSGQRQLPGSSIRLFSWWTDVSALFKAVGGFIALLVIVSTFVLTFHPFGVGNPTVPPPTALQVIDRARTAPLTDATGTITISPFLGGSSGTFLLTRNPSASYYQTTSPLSSGSTTTSITIGNMTYERRTPPSTAPWKKTPGSSPIVVPVLTQLLSPYTNPTLIGREGVNGRDTYHLKQTASSSLGSETYEIWVRADNFFPSKQVHTYPLVGGITNTATLLFTDWNTGEAVNTPATSMVAP